MLFKGRLRRQRDRRDGVGDLARDLGKWLRPPRAGASPGAYRQFVGGRGGGRPSSESLAEAWREFTARP